MLVGERDQLYLRGEAELGRDIAELALGHGFADENGLSDFRIREATGE